VSRKEKRRPSQDEELRREDGREKERGRLTDLPGLDRSPLVSLDPDGDKPHGGEDGAGLEVDRDRKESAMRDGKEAARKWRGQNEQ